MSELFAVQVAAVSKTSAKLAVRSVHPDSGPVAPTSTFALMLVYDPIMSSGFSEMSAYSHLEASPLAREMDRDNYLDPTWIRENANGFIAKAKVSKGVLEVWPTHPAWIEHLRKGMAWETAAYDNGPGNPTTLREPSDGDSTEHSADPAEGFRVGAPQSTPSEQPFEGSAFLPLHGPNRYVADPIIEDRAAINEAIQSMAGQPVLVVPTRGPNKVGTLLEPADGYFYLYAEGGGGYGYMSVNLDEVKSLGRAWLKVASTNGAPPSESNETSESASKTSKPKSKAASKSKGKSKSKPKAKAASKSKSKAKAASKSKAAAKSASKSKSKSASKSKSKSASKSKSKSASKSKSKSKAKSK